MKPATSATGSSGSNSTPFFKRLIRAEMAERRAKGLCYNCDELYSVEHKCKRLFRIEVPDSDSDQDEEATDDPEISLHAISGLRSSQTMQLQALVAGWPFWVLVDSGSTHNFVREGAIEKMA